MKTLLILHGWQDAPEEWQIVKTEIEKSGIKVVVPDLPGFKKQYELDRPWNLDDYVEWAKKFVYQNIDHKFFILGYSFGGRVAMKFIAKYPEKVSGLILVSSAGVSVRPKAKIAIFWAFSKIGTVIFSLPILRQFRPLLRRVIYFIAGTTDFKRIETEYLKETFKMVIKEDLKNLLPKINVPTFILWGDKDIVTPLKDAYLMHKKIPNSELEILKDFKHCSYIQFPKITAQKIISFINQNDFD